MLIPLAIIIIVAVAVFVLSRRPLTRRGPIGSETTVSPQLAADLDRWVEAGLVESHQAEAIAAFEVVAAGPPRRISLATEALGYVGAALATAAVFAALVTRWEDFSEGVHLGVPAVAAALMVAAGALVFRNSEPALRRLGSVLWFLAVAATAMTLSVLTLEIAGMEDRFSAEAIAVTVSSGTAAVAAVLWLLSRSGLQVAALFGATIALLTSFVVLLPGPDEAWPIAVAVWAFGGVWVALGWRQVLTPMPVAVGLGAAAVLIGPALGVDQNAWLFVPALGTAATAMAVSIPARQVPLLAAGTTGLFIYLTWMVVDFFGETLGVPVALGVCGLLFIGLAIVAGRLRRMTLPPGSAGDRLTMAAS